MPGMVTAGPRRPDARSVGRVRPTIKICAAKAVSKRRNKRVLIASGAAVAYDRRRHRRCHCVGSLRRTGLRDGPRRLLVVSSTQSTLAQRTADVTFTGSVSADSRDVPINGTGQVDFDTNTFSATLSENVASTSIVIRGTDRGPDQFYMGMTINGQDMSQITGGAHWVSISLPDQSSSRSLGAANVDPIGQLKALEQRGATVTSLGTKTIDGTTVSGYSVTPSHQEIENTIQQEIEQNQISSTIGQQLLQGSSLFGTFTSDVWIDGSGLVRQEVVNVSGGSAGISGKVTMSFADYGTTVSIATPAPSDVIPYTQFLNDLKSAQTSLG